MILKYGLIRWCFIAFESWLTWKRIFILKNQHLRILLKEHCSKLNLLQHFHSMFCKNVAHLMVARGCHIWIHSLATAKRATFLQNILWESCSKFYSKQCSHKKFIKILIHYCDYMKMCFHGNQYPWAIKHPFISLSSKYQSPKYICLTWSVGR